VILVGLESADNRAGVDVLDVSKGVMAWIDLLDTLVKGVLMIWWLIAIAIL
jgi:hypothetical protein